MISFLLGTLRIWCFDDFRAKKYTWQAHLIAPAAPPSAIDLAFLVLSSPLDHGRRDDNQQLYYYRVLMMLSRPDHTDHHHPQNNIYDTTLFLQTHRSHIYGVLGQHKG